jgi:ATP-dependent helicase/DNAse subunit B
MANAVEITVSDVKRFVRCRYAWDYSSDLRQGLSPKTRANHFLIGDLFHQAFERHYEGIDAAEWFEAQAADVIFNTPMNQPGYEKLVEQLFMGPDILRLY